MVMVSMVSTVVGGVLVAASSSRLPVFAVVISGGALVGGLVSGVRFWRRRWAILDTPTSKCVAVFAGRNEVVGQAAPSEPLTAPVIREPAVWFRWQLQKWVRSGKSSRWETIDEATSDRSFWLTDDTGRVLVRPAGAEIHAPRVFHARAHRSGVAHMHHEGRPIVELGRNHRISEWCIRPGQVLYVLGRASLDEDTATMQFVPGDGDGDGGPGGAGRSDGRKSPFDMSGDDDHLLISTHGEARMARASLFLAVLNLLISWVGLTLLPAAIHAVVSLRSRPGPGSGPEPGSPSTLDAAGVWMLAAAALFGALLVCAYWLRLYNRLVVVKQQAAKAWSLIDVALRRRHDLLPNLVEVAERYAAHEREVIETARRSRSGTVIPAHEELPTDDALRQAAEVHRIDRAGAEALLALAEAYPDLKADEVFRDLARRITDAQNQVAYARAFYNDSVTVLRDRRGTFPGLLLAGAVRTPSWDLFAPDDAPTPSTPSTAPLPTAR
jgi:LemA protein